MVTKNQLRAIRSYYWHKNHSISSGNDERKKTSFIEGSISWRVLGRDIKPYYKRYYEHLKAAQNEKLIIDDKNIAEVDGLKNQDASELFAHPTYQYDYFLSRLYHYLAQDHESWNQAVFLANYELEQAAKAKGIKAIKFNETELILTTVPDKYKKNSSD